MANFGTNVGEHFAKNVVRVYFEQAVAPEITNQDYEGTISKGGGDRLNVLTFGALSLKSYSGSALTVDTPSESEGILVIDQKKAYYFQIESFARFSSYVKNPESTLIQDAGKTLAETVDTFVLAKHGDVASGNRVGTDYTTGTVEVTVTTGAVAGSGTTFTAAMVGLGFKATGHTSWYRIKSFSSTTAIVIEDDSDDETSAYTGGAISAGATYTIEANAAISLAKDTVYGYILDLRQKLDSQKVPKSDRWLVVPSAVGRLLRQANELIPAVPTAYENVVTKGLIGMIAGFKVYENEQVADDGTSGNYWVLAGHKSWQTMAMAMTESGVEDFIGGFGRNYKGLWCYGSKVVDERRKAAAALRCTV